ncbi:polysaccharide biosynthesis protein [Methanolobus sediminis]|uniref:Polysaccharide biosynthesis protein n=1 Tax=Methanolobus sediminis TaxID=3072978 RepID=A0AA51UN78_9EURY|nr:oligosaccharide flippase family protein [Methanolobus sediminis]WMW25426.1 polysaccharide biosynthesis protein [Methanolobus sediminis]
MFNLNNSPKKLSKQLPRNIFANFGYFGLSIVIGIFLVPYFVDTLGVSGYAIIPLATSITGYVGLVSQSLQSSVSRYITIDIQKEDYLTARKTFNTALFGTLGLCVLLLPLVFVISFYAPDYFSIPDEQKKDATILFIGVISAFLLRAWGSNFGVALFAHNRLDLQNTINSIDILVRLFFILILFFIFTPRLSYVGIAHFLGALAGLLLSILFSQKIDSNLVVSIKDFQISRLKSITDTGGWITINQIGSLLFLQIELILVNKLFGTATGGEYALIIVWSSLIRRIAGLFAGVLTPVILSYYSKNMFEEILTITKSAVKIMGILIALPIGLMCGFSPLLLSLWVGPEFARLWPLMVLQLVHLVINLSVLPLFSINVAFNKIKIPGLVTFLMGIGNLVLSLVLSLFTGWGYYAVAIAGAIMLTAKNSLFTSLYASRVLNVYQFTFIKSLISGMLSVLIVSGIAGFINYYTNVSTLSGFIAWCTLISVVYIVFSWIFSLTKYERMIIHSFIPLNVRRWLKIDDYC